MSTQPAGSFWRGRSVLVTGIGGFVGSALAARLDREGASVVGVLRDRAGVRLLNDRGMLDRIDLVHGSLTEPGLVQRVLNEYEVTAVFHLAAQSLVQVAHRSPISTFESNIAATWHVLEAARLTPLVTSVVIASSDKAYGTQAVLPYTEETTLAGAYPYEASKVCADVLARCYSSTYGLPVAVVRCANLYGPGDVNWSRIVPGTIRAALAGEEPIIRSDGTPERDYLYIDDGVAAYVSVAERLPELAGQAFNFGPGAPVSVLELVGQILKATGSDSRPHILGKARNEIDRQSLDASKARRVLGWEPKTSLEDGLAASIDWYRKLLRPGTFHPAKPAVAKPAARSPQPVSQVKAVILCGGRGTRANPYTRRVPKALIPVAGLPLIEHVLRIYASHGVKEFVLATGYLGEEIVRYFKRGPWNVTCLDTGDTTDTAGRLRSCLDHLGETFHIAYVDGLGTMDLTALLQVHRERGLAATMLSAPLRSQYGVIESDNEDRVIRFAEKPVLSGYWINAGYFVFDRSALEQVKGDSLEVDVLPELSRRNQLQTYRHTGFWRSLDTLKDQRELDELWRPYAASLESSVPAASQLPQWLSRRYSMAAKQSQ